MPPFHLLKCIAVAFLLGDPAAAVRSVKEHTVYPAVQSSASAIFESGMSAFSTSSMPPLNPSTTKQNNIQLAPVPTLSKSTSTNSTIRASKTSPQGVLSRELLADKNSYDCKGSFECTGIFQYSPLYDDCKTAISYIDPSRFYGTKPKNFDTGECHASDTDYNRGCGVFIKGDNCERKGEDMITAYNKLRKDGGCAKCGSVTFSDGCSMRVDYVVHCYTQANPWKFTAAARLH